MGQLLSRFISSGEEEEVVTLVPLSFLKLPREMQWMILDKLPIASVVKLGDTSREYFHVVVDYLQNKRSDELAGEYLRSQRNSHVLHATREMGLYTLREVQTISNLLRERPVATYEFRDIIYSDPRPSLKLLPLHRNAWIKESSLLSNILYQLSRQDVHFYLHPELSRIVMEWMLRNLEDAPFTAEIRAVVLGPMKTSGNFSYTRPLKSALEALRHHITEREGLDNAYLREIVLILLRKGAASGQNAVEDLGRNLSVELLNRMLETPDLGVSRLFQRQENVIHFLRSSAKDIYEIRDRSVIEYIREAVQMLRNRNILPPLNAVTEGMDEDRTRFWTEAYETGNV